MTDRPATDGLLSPGADETFAALADRTRRRILVRLAERPDDAGAVAKDLEVSRQAVAKHLRILEGAGIVQATMVSRRRVHTVAPSRIREISDLLGVVATGWDGRLARIKERAEGQDRAEQDRAEQDRAGQDRATERADRPDRDREPFDRPHRR